MLPTRPDSSRSGLEVRQKQGQNRPDSSSIILTGKSDGLVRTGDRTREAYRVMSANQVRFRVATMARVLGVSTSGYYAWRRRPPSARAGADAELTARVQEIHAGSRGTYGAPRIHAELAEAGVAVGRKRVARVMRAAGIAGVSRRRGPRTTRREVQDRPAPDRVERRFEADAPNRLWVADITYIPTLVRRFDIEVGHCSQCRRRIQGRHALQTSDALGTASAQLGPGVVALVVELHTHGGMPLAKVADLLQTRFGLHVTPGGLANLLHRAGTRRAAGLRGVVRAGAPLSRGHGG